MCFLTCIVKIKSDESILPAIADMMYDEQDTNDDGTGSYCFNKTGEMVYEKRVAKEDYYQILDNLKNFDVVNYHFRNGTGGETGQHNFHFWRIGKWLFAHNGVASSFGNAKDCDSLDLFKKLINKHYLGNNGFINVKKIKKFINASNFTGRLVIINSEHKKIYFLGDFKTYLINRSYLVVTSSISTFENKEKINALGLTFETEEQIELEVLESTIDGVVCFSFKDGFLELDEKFKEYVYNSGYQKTYEEKNTEKIEEYYARVEDVDEYFVSAEYQEELNKINAKYNAVELEIGQNYTDENLKKLEDAEVNKELEIANLDEKFFELKTPIKQMALVG